MVILQFLVNHTFLSKRELHLVAVECSMSMVGNLVFRFNYSCCLNGEYVGIVRRNSN